MAWCIFNNDNKTHQVGTMAANSLTLHDMSGNVREWCWDWWSDGITKDTPSGGAASGSGRVHRGGSWRIDTNGCMVSDRYGDWPEKRRDDLGFRLVRSAN